MNVDPISNRVLDKVKRLIALSNNNTNVNESATAFAQAQAILSKHRLTMAEVDAASSALAGELISESSQPLYQGERVIHWKSYLAGEIAAENGCKVFTRTFRNPVKIVKYVIVGRESDIQVVRYMFESIIEQIEFFVKLAMKSGEGSGKTFSNNFKYGAADTVVKRIKEANLKIRDEYKGTQALVLVDNRFNEVQRWVEKMVPNMKTSKAVSFREDRTGYYLGKQAGQKVSLNKELK